MFQPNGLTIWKPPVNDLTQAKSLDVILGLPNLKELPTRASRVPIEQYYETLRTDFVISKVDPADIEVGDRMWADEAWMYSMPPDLIHRVQDMKNGMYRFTATTTAGEEMRHLHFTVPSEKPGYVGDWPLYRLAKFGDVDNGEVARLMGNLTRGAYAYNGLCWFAYLSPFQRRKVFASGLFSTLVRTHIKIQIPRAMS